MSCNFMNFGTLGGMNPFASTGNTFMGLGMAPYGKLTNSTYAYLPFMNYSPMGITNFGGDIQMFPVEPYQSTRVGLAFNNLAAQAFGMSGITDTYMTSPTIDMNAIQNNVSQIMSTGFNQMASQYINTTAQALSSQKTKLQAKLNDNNTKAEDKPKIQEQIKKLEEYEKQLEELKKADTDPQSAYKKATEIYTEVKNTITEQNATQQPNGASGGTPAAGSQQPQAAGNQPSQPASNQQVGNAQGQVSQTVSDRVNDFYDAVNGIGTKNKKMEKAITDTVNDKTLVEFALRWNNKYSPKNGESMIEAFMDDADHGQAQDLLPGMINCLYEKAEAMGVCDEEFKAAYNKILDELTPDLALIGMDDDVVCENFNLMLQKIAPNDPNAKPAQKA